MFKKITMVVLMMVASVFSQATIYGRVQIDNNTDAGVSFRVIYEDAISEGKDSISTVAGTFSKVFPKGFLGKIYLHPISPGFLMPSTVYVDTLWVNGHPQSGVYNFKVVDTAKPVISNIVISPSGLKKVGDSLTLKYRIVDNLWRVVSKKVEISYDGGNWVTIDNMLSTGVNNFNANPSDTTAYFLAYQEGKAKKYLLSGVGTAQIKISHSDSSGNVGVALSGVFQVIPSTSTRLSVKPATFSAGAGSIKVFNIKGQLIGSKVSKGYYVKVSNHSYSIISKIY